MTGGAGIDDGGVICMACCGGTEELTGTNGLILVEVKSVPRCQEGSQWQRLVLPSCMLEYVASAMCPVAGDSQSLPSWEQLPWVQQYLKMRREVPRLLLPPRPRRSLSR